MKILGAIVAVGLALAGSRALAEPGLGNKVYSPYVLKGMTEVELRGGALHGGPLDGEGAGVLELEHGFSDRVSLAVLGEFEHHASGESKLDAIAVEGVVYLGQIPKLGVDVGAYLEYEQRLHNESGILEAKLLLARQVGPVQARLNLIASRPLTDRPGEDVTALAYAAQATVEAGRRLQVGLQAFGDLGTDRRLGGRQAHYIGPVVDWQVRPSRTPGELEFEVAYLLPVGTARDDADGQFRFVLEYERHF